MKKRVLAMICCITMLFSLLAALPSQTVRAADDTVIYINTAAFNSVLGYRSVQNGGVGYLNIPYTGMGSDYSVNNGPFLTESYAKEWITFGGGMTYADLSDGAGWWYLATNDIIQFGWQNRTAEFKIGWSFTMKHGTPMTYKTESGEVRTAVLGMDYTFTFTDGNSEYDNIVTVTAKKTSYFGMKTGVELGNGNTADAGTLFEFDGNTFSDAKVTYHPMQNETAAYAEYIDFDGIDYADLADKGVKFRYVLDAVKCIQMENWGTLRNEFTIGSQIVFKKGMPITYTDTAGDTCESYLDATYVYECVTKNSDHDQIWNSVKVNDTAVKIGLDAINYQTDVNYVNIMFDAASKDKVTLKEGTYVQDNILTERVAQDYLDLSGCSVDLREKGAKILFIPSANVIQLAFGDAAKEALKAGDVIVMKKGMPVAYNDGENNLRVVTLDNNYAFTVTSRVNDILKISCQVTTTYSLKGTMDGPGDELDCWYFNAPFADDAFNDRNGDHGGTQLSDDVLLKYFEVSGKTSGTLLNDGWFLKRWIKSAYKMVRFYGPKEAWDLQDGDYVMFKKGLPITYTGSDGKEVVGYLDKDYGFTYNGTGFKYDASLGNQDENGAGTTVFDFNGTDFSTALLDGEGKESLAASNLAKLLTDTTSVPAGFTDSVYGGGNTGYASVPIDFGAPIDLAKITSIKVRMFVPAGTTDGENYFRILSNDSPSVAPNKLVAYSSVGGVMGQWSDVDITDLLPAVQGTDGTVGRFIIAFRHPSGPCYFDKITVKHTGKFLLKEEFDFEDPALTEDHYADVDHGSYVIDDADTVTIDGETYQRGDVYTKLGEHTLVYTTHGQELSRKIYIYRLGDTDSDGEVGLKDYMRQLKYLHDKDSVTVSKCGEKAMDMDGNQTVNATDKIVLARYLITDSGLLPTYPINGTITAGPSEAANKLITDYVPQKADKIRNDRDIYHRDVTKLSWFDYDDNTSYTVRLSTKADMSDAVTYTTDTNSLELINLLAGTDYYWTVTGGKKVSAIQHFQTAATIRTLTVDGLSNTRDCGGWATTDGGVIRQGLVYRGAKPDNITQTGKAQIASLGIKTDLDLRKPSEAAGLNGVSPLGSDVQYINYNAPYYWNDSAGINTEAYKEALVNEIKVYADASNYPIYVHCAVGRDRTGTICFLINALCGVSEKDLYLDYEFSLLSSAGTLDNATTQALVEWNFKGMYDNLMSHYANGGTIQNAVENFMLSIGITESEIASIRSILVEK